MALRPPDMTKCNEKRRCLTGDNEFLAYEVDQPCPEYHTFSEVQCDCISDSAAIWTITYNYAPIAANVNCTGLPNGGLCGLGPAQGPYTRTVGMFGGARTAYVGQVFSGHNGACGGSDLLTGTVAEMTGAVRNYRNTWELASSVSYTNSVSTAQWLGFVVTDKLGSSLQDGDLLVVQFGPIASGAVNCPEEQYFITSVAPAGA